MQDVRTNVRLIEYEHKPTNMRYESRHDGHTPRKMVHKSFKTEQID